MTPAQAIGMLDRQLAKHGETLSLRRGGTPPLSVNGRGFVRAFKPQDLVGEVQQGDTMVVLSPNSVGMFPIPILQGDKIVVAGRVKNVEAAEHVRMLDQVVRINVQVRG